MQLPDSPRLFDSATASGAPVPPALASKPRAMAYRSNPIGKPEVIETSAPAYSTKLTQPQKPSKTDAPR